MASIGYKITYILVSLLLTTSWSTAQQTVVSKKMVLMGSLFEFTIIANDSLTAEKYISLAANEVSRIENEISEWQPHTAVSLVNQHAGIRPIQVTDEVFELTKRALQYSQMSDGAFDISIAALDKIWRFDGSMDELPTTDEIALSIRNVGYENIILDDTKNTIYLKNKGMKIGFGSIGKGYAADKARELMISNGITSGIINAAGDIACWGTQADGKPWKIGIRNPFKRHGIAKILKLKNTAVATSGSYEKYAEINSKRYSHIIDPQTGYPASGLTSVTVFGPSTEFANALSTTIMVVGYREGKKLLKQFPEYDYLVITDKGKIKKKFLFFY